MIYVNSITICPENITITEGKWYYGAYAEICPTNATCKCVTWNSSNSNVASVNEHGYICGVTEGTAVIYAIAQDGSGTVGFCTVTVVPPIKVSSITVMPSNKSASVGEMFNLSTIVCPTNAEDKRIRWTSCDCSVAEVDYLTGCVTAKSAGTTCICANAVDGSGIYGCCTVTIKNRLVTSIKVTPSEKTIAIDAYVNLSATVIPSNAANKVVRWYSVNENIATVDVASGYVVGKSPGTVEIRAIATDGSGALGSCTVTVNDLSDVNSDSWERMGFKYDGSQRDFIRLNQDLPPYSYERWILNGRQKALFIVDQNGSAGIIGAGHARLLIRNNEGLWYRTEFVKNSDADDVIIEYFQISESEKDERTSGKGVDYVCLCGDYMLSLKKAKEISEDQNNTYNGQYNPISNNCLHYVNEILGYGDNVNDEIDAYIATNDCIIPQTYYDNLVEILNL